MKIKRRTIAVVSLLLIAFTAYLLSPSFYEQQTYGTQLGVEIHVEMWHYRDGKLILYSHHPGVLTTLGQDWIEDQLGDSPSTDPAKWIAVSNDPTAPSSAWTAIPAEITTGGMGRAVGTYADDGTGAWNITKSFSPTESGSCQLTGLYWAITGNFLLCADTFTQVNYENGDTVEIRWSLSVTGS